MDVITSLEESCRLALSAHGRLSTALPDFIPRAPQSDLAEAIAKTIITQTTLVAEAGTGTGKTYAYLIPCLLSGKKVIISTATKTLQDQLYQKDLPTLIKALGLAVRTQNLKGRANYLCQYRVQLYSEEGQLQSPMSAHEISYIRNKLSQMVSGERSELPEISEDSPVWHYVTSTTDNCLGSECPNHETCFLVKARKRAMEADIVIINHHLFFADSRLKQEGFGELLPGVDVVVFDEAHQLTEVAIHFNGERVGTRQFKDLIEDLVREWPVLDLANQPFKMMSHRADLILDELMNALPQKEDKLGWNGIQHNQAFMKAWEEWMKLKQELQVCLNENPCSSTPGLQRCNERFLELNATLNQFNHSSVDKIRWIERFKHTLVFHSTPYEVADYFNELMTQRSCAYVFTSATLTMASSFDCFCKPLGLKQANTMLLPSPFRYEEQALLYLPRGLPDPKDTQYYEHLVNKVLPVINACGGRSFFLFTSHKALKQVAQLMVNTLNYPLLIQGDEAKPILLARFRQLGNAVLLGTATFWEGVDVKGEALSCVIIDKLPFANPFEPVTRGRMSYLEEQGVSGFDEFSLPNAVIALKQGVGRLIRDVNDKGVLMIADPRLTAREYGRQILASLPRMPRTRDENRVLQFIRELALDYEYIGD